MLALAFALALVWPACVAKSMPDGEAICVEGEVRPHVDRCNTCTCDLGYWHWTGSYCTYVLEFDDDHRACHGSRVADLDSEAPGVQASCTIELRQPGEAVIVVPLCDGSEPEWALPDGATHCWFARGDPSAIASDCEDPYDPEAPVIEVELLTASGELPEGEFRAACQVWIGLEDWPCAAEWPLEE